MNSQFIENGQDNIHQHFFTPENVKPTFDGQPEADDNEPQKLVDYLYVDTTPWDKTKHSKEAEITGDSNPIGLKGVIRFLKDRKEFDLKIRLYHGYKSKGNPETGTLIRSITFRNIDPAWYMGYQPKHSGSGVLEP